MAVMSKTDLVFTEPMLDMTKATGLATTTINEGVAMIKRGMADSGDAMVDKGVAILQEDTEPAVELKTSEFRDADSFHNGSGQAAVYRGPYDAHFLWLKNLDATNGPDIHVTLSPLDDPTEVGDLKDSGCIDLGKLKGKHGNQNYEIPDNVDISSQQSIVIYCVSFQGIFSVAPLKEVS